MKEDIWEYGARVMEGFSKSVDKKREMWKSSAVFWVSSSTNGSLRTRELRVGIEVGSSFMTFISLHAKSEVNTILSSS